jgi:hypothetical protein
VNDPGIVAGLMIGELSFFLDQHDRFIRIPRLQFVKRCRSYNSSTNDRYVEPHVCCFGCKFNQSEGNRESEMGNGEQFPLFSINYFLFPEKNYLSQKQPLWQN